MIPIFSFLLMLKNNITPILIAVGVIAFSIVGYKMYRTIQDAAALRVVVETQKATIENKNKLITGLEKDIKLRDEIITERDKEIDDLNVELSTTTQNLGVDAANQAPDSLKEYFRRRIE